MSDWLGLRDKVCVVTGAASGIGRGIVLAFAAAGSKVVALDREPDGCARTADEVKRRGATAMPLFCDVTERRPGRRQCGRGGRRGLAYRMAAAVERVALVISGTKKVGKINTLAASRSARSSETRSEMLCKRASVEIPRVGTPFPVGITAAR